MKIEPDMPKFQAALTQLAKLEGKTSREVVLDQGALFARDSMKATPPFAGAPIKEGMPAQKKVGDIAISRDVQRSFKAMDDVGALRDPSLAKAFKRIARGKQSLAAEKLLKDAKYLAVAGVVDEPTERLHNMARNAAGKVTRKRGQWFTWRKSAVNRFITLKKATLGRAKAGWLIVMAGINDLRGHSTFQPSPWITRHTSEPGAFKGTGTDHIFEIICSNDIPFAQKHTPNVEKVAWRSRMISAPKQAEKLYRAMERKAKQAAT